MKECENCGAPLSNHELFCSQCGEKIETPIGNDERSTLPNHSNDSFYETDPLVASPADKIAGFLSIAAIVIMFFLCSIKEQPVLFVFPAFSVIVLGYNVINAFFPEQSWAWEMKRVIYIIKDEKKVEPTPTWLAMRKFSLWAYIIILLVVFFIVYSLV